MTIPRPDNNTPMGLRKITGIMACDPHGVISSHHQLPWHYPEDTKFYKDKINQNIVIMGHTTYLGMPPSFFDTHHCIVFSKKISSTQYITKQLIIVPTLEAFQTLTTFPTHKSSYMIGGASVAELFLKQNLLDNFLLTKITRTYPGDTYFNQDLLAHWPRTCIKKEPEFEVFHYYNPTSCKNKTL
jgi:dihydrofolate reductase